MTSRTRSFGLFRGTFDDFSSDWYATVGVAIVSTLALSYASDVACYGAAYVLNHWSRFADRGYSNDVARTKQLTQAGLNAVYTGQAMRFEVRYAALTKFLFVAALFSAGVPASVETDRRFGSARRNLETRSFRLSP